MYQKIAATVLSLGIAMGVLPNIALAQNIIKEPTLQPFYGFSMGLGDYKIIALNDGQISLKVDIFKNTSTGRSMQELLDQSFITYDKGLNTSVNAFIINTGDKLLLVDTGAGQCFGDTTGKIAQHIQSAGYQLTDINAVLLTHAHGDHICGLTRDNQAVFPNATVYLSNQEATYWLDKSKSNEGGFKTAQLALAPYIQAKKVKQFSDGDTLFTGITAMLTPGHTPGHTSYLVESKHDKVLLLGDIIHNYAMQFPQPGITLSFDWNPEMAAETRAKIFTDVAQGKYKIAGMHLPFPGIGHIAKDNNGYRWYPVDYTILP